MDILKTNTANHRHRWMFLQVKGNYVLAGDGVYKFVEYAYLVCNGPGHEAMIRKTEVENLEDLEFENPKQ